MEENLPYSTKEFKIIGFNGETGSFEGYASVFGVKDLVNDVVVKGAFARTIDHHKGVVTLLWQHMKDKIIGVGEIAEDEKGLKIKGQLNLNVQAGKEAHELLKQGAVKGLSIGYDPIDDERQKDGTRLLKEVRLWEISVVTWPALPSALVDSVKAEQPKNPLDAALDFLEAVKPEDLDQEHKERTAKVLQSLLEPAQAKAAPVSDEIVDGDPELFHSLMELIEEIKKQ